MKTYLTFGILILCALLVIPQAFIGVRNRHNLTDYATKVATCVIIT